jgi:hypothetical protein
MLGPTRIPQSGGEAVYSFFGGFPNAPAECPWCGFTWRVTQFNRLIGAVRNMLNDLDGFTCLQPNWTGKGLCSRTLSRVETCNPSRSSSPTFGDCHSSSSVRGWRQLPK